jgi:hypothetical protein
MTAQGTSCIRRTPQRDAALPTALRAPERGRAIAVGRGLPTPRWANNSSRRGGLAPSRRVAFETRGLSPDRNRAFAISAFPEQIIALDLEALGKSLVDHHFVERVRIVRAIMVAKKVTDGFGMRVYFAGAHDLPQHSPFGHVYY